VLKRVAGIPQAPNAEPPEGWRREVKARITMPMESDIYYYCPSGNELRSRPDVQRFLNRNPHLPYNIEAFDFTTRFLEVAADADTAAEPPDASVVVLDTDDDDDDGGGQPSPPTPPRDPVPNETRVGSGVGAELQPESAPPNPPTHPSTAVAAVAAVVAAAAVDFGDVDAQEAKNALARGQEAPPEAPSANLPTPLKTQLKNGHGGRVGVAGSSRKKKPPGPEKVVRKVSPVENPEELKDCCHVCWDGESFEENPILYCEVCDIAVHQMCYGIATIPEVGPTPRAPTVRRNTSPFALHYPYLHTFTFRKPLTRTRQLTLFTKAASASHTERRRNQILTSRIKLRSAASMVSQVTSHHRTQACFSGLLYLLFIW